MNISSDLRMSVYSALFAALIAVGAYIAIPIGAVPIVLQNMFVLMAALLLGAKWGLAAVGLYLFMGACGLPVFAGGAGGIGRLFGPTGGYLLGYIPAVFAAGFISQKVGKNLFGDTFAMVIASLIVYLSGVPWLKFVTAMSWNKAFIVGIYPFIIGDLIKIVAAAYCVKFLRPMLNK
ncbi:MAG: biotin transporter BioY [Desulfamplus sp.]|nr:biotin transporter BioY [Desulfamplus sp.]MBF0241204.1 biotin transporter BioY [Desulfamplus sp.]MBF0389934.1 biotin transporter BioY [Desulfamplus sp.]